MEGVPVASALFLPPTAGEAPYGRDGRRSATLILYVEPRTADGQVPSAGDLATWYRRLSLAMALTGAFADFLDKELGLGTFDEPPAQFGVWLQSSQPLTVMVDVNGCGSYRDRPADATVRVHPAPRCLRPGADSDPRIIGARSIRSRAAGIRPALSRQRTEGQSSERGACQPAIHHGAFPVNGHCRNLMTSRRLGWSDVGSVLSSVRKAWPGIPGAQA
jgi:hypothetical protein